MYVPTPVPAKAENLPNYLSTELQALAQSLQGAVPFLMLQTLSATPVKPREGMVVKFDGVHVNPGSGAGVYCYRAGAWQFLG